MRIMLACASGMSTSMLVQKMKQEADKRGEEHTIWAAPIDEVAERLGTFDVLLLGPQVRMYKDKMEATVKGEAPVEVIPPVSYGRCDGKAVLDLALSMK